MVGEGYALASVRKVLTQASFLGGEEVDLSGALGTFVFAAEGQRGGGGRD